MNQFIDAQFKDCTPAATVERIKQILADHNIEVEEQWRETSVPYCYAMSARVVGTTFGVNGKGLSKEFAMASGYGELMERMQNGYLYAPEIQKDGTSTYERGQDIYESIDTLMQDNGDCYRLLAERLKQYTGVTMTPEQILKQFANSDGTLKVTPYYNLIQGRVVNFPNALNGRVYTSNGCAAGNSPEETIVQAISEIVERHHMIQINDGGISLPDIPEDVLKKFKTAYEIIEYIRRQGYRVVVKDCSLGQQFPVVCVYIIDRATGRYHTHFGAYANFEIALERALTESFQGKNIRNIAQYEDFLHKTPGEFSFESLSNEFVQGTHKKTTSFFLSPPTHPYNESMGFSGKDNKALLGECLRFFREQGYDVLIRDCSCLGFYTYQVIIPGYSEIFIHRLCNNLNEHRYAIPAIKVLTNPSAAQLTDYLGFLMHDAQMKKYTSNIAGVRGFLACSQIAAIPPASLERFLMAASKGYVFYALGKHAQVIDCLNGMIPYAPTGEKNYLICLKRYLTLKLRGYAQEQIEELLNYMHSPETVEKLMGQLNRKENPLDEFTLHCDYEHCDGCRLAPYCRQKRVLELAALLQKKRQELDFNGFCEQMAQLMAEVAR